ncbi:hypothetical protein SCLCIDRAFT_1209610 [Scleroderma citrinum Foug A]|uniref:Uncharacterized protein n=1 Tax=Scleroderma citrinum Foug A TaxID=1036808 RepID=A0A0C3E5Z6_9AGAM|nr:hypothetical protein SCLCIDRAFT_1209610 [Scleroderma citrinum Foug A]
MDANSASTSRSTPKGHRPAEDIAKPKAAQRGCSRYKEKYQALREKFDQVNTEHEDWNRKLELANARIKKLQAENDLLLDAISIAVPATPSLLHLIQPSSTSITPVPTPPHVQQHSTGQAPHHHMNGHAYSHSNGRYREREPERLERRDLTPHGHESITNGHPS